MWSCLFLWKGNKIPRDSWNQYSIDLQVQNLWEYLNWTEGTEHGKEKKTNPEDYGSFRDQETRIRVQFAVLKVVVHLDVAALSAPIYGTFWLIQNKTGFGYKVCPHLLFKWVHSASQNFYIHEFFQANTIVKGAEMRELCFSSPHREILGMKPLVKAAGMLSCLLVGKNWAL